jgi:prepilin-type N-terminal cleavage/methylation domain-containing protein
MKSDMKKEHGFTLIECMIAMLIFVVGGLAMAGLLAQGIRLSTESRTASLANAVARAKIEELRVTPRTNAQRTAGGNLTSDVANHFDTPAGTTFRRRWTVANGPAGTQDITIAVTMTNTTIRLPATQVRVLLP